MEIGTKVRVITTRTDFLKESVGMVGTVVGTGETEGSLLVELSHKVAGGNTWVYLKYQLREVKA